MKITSHNEWDKLKEVVLGTARYMTVGLEFSEKKPVTKSLLDKAARIARKALPDWYVEEINEDLENLSGIFKQFGATVIRPSDYGSSKLFSTPDWQATGKDLYNVRDIHLVVGNTVITGPSSARCRYFEPNAFYGIWYDYFQEGFRWIVAPKPRLVGEYSIPYYRDGDQVLTEEDVLHRKLGGGRSEKFYKLAEEEILFDAANVIRLGRDLVYLISSTANHLGAKWLQSVLGEKYRVHLTTTYRSSHIDSTILPLRVGLVLLNSARVTPKTCPKLFGKWTKIYFKDVAPTPESEIKFQKNVRDKAYKELLSLGVSTDLNHMSSPWAGLNVLSLDPKTVLVHDRQTKLIKELERHKLTVIPVRMRHPYTILGGLHCSTLDTVREGKLEDYFE